MKDFQDREPENVCCFAGAKQKGLIFMKELLESGKVVPVIDGCYPLGKAAEALRYFEKVHAKGKVVIAVEQNN